MYLYVVLYYLRLCNTTYFYNKVYTLHVDVQYNMLVLLTVYR